MIRKVKNIITSIFEHFKNIKKSQFEVSCEIRELLWSQIYHDSIRGKSFLEKTPFYIGRWAGNYTFFYVLNRVLSDYNPKNVLEFGLGETSKFISTYLENELIESRHTIIEHDIEWISNFENRFALSNRSNILQLNLSEVSFQDHIKYTYEGIEQLENEIYDLYVVDGPYGSVKDSRTDIFNQLSKLTSTSEFIIIFDDTHRKGELDTLRKILETLDSLNIKYQNITLDGSTSVSIIATEKYKYAISI